VCVLGDREHKREIPTSFSALISDAPLANLLPPRCSDRALARMHPLSRSPFEAGDTLVFIGPCLNRPALGINPARKGPAADKLHAVEI
jgi:hypothetical protein